MIISRTPLRISFCGGGSDLPSFYQYSSGAVVSTAINKYIYITVNKKFDDEIRASYSITEFAKKPEDLKHELIREALLKLRISGGIEITSISDIPSSGTGLGSSSTYTVGLLNALHAYQHTGYSASLLAEEACEIEIEKCHKPIGKQDQYAAAFGNLNYIEFNQDGTVEVTPIICKPETKKELQENLLMLYTGISRPSDAILKEQNTKTQNEKQTQLILSDMVLLAGALRGAIASNHLRSFGKLLHENWLLKKRLASNISSDEIDSWYRIALKHGALGGKILGAGGGGFLLLYAPKEYHQEICEALPLQRKDFAFEQEGSRIIYYGDK